MRPQDQALVPDFFRPPVQEATKIIKKPVKGDEETLLSLSESEAWNILKGIINRKKAALEHQMKKTAGTCKTLEEIGWRYALMDQICAAYDSVIDAVEIHKRARDVTARK
jgi:hypothetical protein